MIKYLTAVKINHPFWGEALGTVISYDGSIDAPAYLVEFSKMDAYGSFVSNSEWFKQNELEVVTNNKENKD